MKKLKMLLDELDGRDDFRVDSLNHCGGAGMFTKGPQKGMTVIWSFDGGWEHVSIDGRRRMPTWDEMCALKDMFWDAGETCVEYHPAADEYVNNLQYCLHIWKPIARYAGKMPTPPSRMVGVTGVRFREGQ